MFLSILISQKMLQSNMIFLGIFVLTFYIFSQLFGRVFSSHFNVSCVFDFYFGGKFVSFCPHAAFNFWVLVSIVHLSLTSGSVLMDAP